MEISVQVQKIKQKRQSWISNFQSITTSEFTSCLIGSAITVFGAISNIIVKSLNGHRMPLVGFQEDIVAAGIANKYVSIFNPNIRAEFLSDWITIPYINYYLSIGDLFIYLGMIVSIFFLVRLIIKKTKRSKNVSGVIE